MLWALKVAQDQPQALSLRAHGAYADLDRLRSEHVWDAFLNMVGNLSAVEAVSTPTP